MSATTDTDLSFEALLEFIRTTRGFDFTGYKRSSLQRRTRRRMDVLGIDGYDEYREYLETNPDEFTALFNTILINVTSFFRDPDAWDALAAELRARVPEHPDAGPVRVWSAGCASGQETYTLVMLLAEMLGAEGFRERVKVYATDVDEEALAAARAATYAEREVEGVPPELRERYFERKPGGWTFRPDLRRHVIFGRHDLVQDAPISHLDLLVCRNVLMYFNAEVQGRVMNRFHYSLKDGGLLFLGRAEMMRAYASLFSPVDLKSRVFARAQHTGLRERLFNVSRPAEGLAAPRAGQQLRLRSAALDADPDARILVDPEGRLTFANAAARALFAVSAADVGRPLQDLTVSYRPVELRSAIERVQAERRPLHLGSVEHPGPGGDMRTFDVQVQPLADGEGPLGGRHLRGHLALPAAGQRAAEHQRGAGDHQRGAAEHHRGAGDHERGAAEHQRGGGRGIRCRVACTPLVGTGREIHGTVVLMEEWRDGTEEA